MKLSACGKTDVGLMRSNNEDSFHLDEQRGLFIVADGMGGHAAGEVASAMAINVCREVLEPLIDQQAPQEQLLKALGEAITGSDHTIAQAAKDNPEWQGMGTTLTILLLHSGQALLGHVGDSRLYRWRSACTEQLSDDHTLIAEQLRRGIIDQLEADSSNLGNILLQAVGLGKELDICLKQFQLEADDRYLLCSDGLTDMLSPEKISRSLTENGAPGECCEKLVAAALDSGGKDNITAVIIRIEST